MLESFLVKNYRLFKELKIDTLKRVNLITGKNNVGKSALLEAMLIYHSLTDLPTINAILKQRGEWVDINDKWDEREKLYKQTDNYRHILYNREVDLENTTQGMLFGEDIDKYISLNYAYSKSHNFLDHPVFHRKYFPESEDSPSAEYFFRNTTFSEYLKHYSTPRPQKNINIKLWDAIELTEKEEDVIQTLQIIHTGIDRLGFDSQTQQAKVRIQGEKKPVLLGSMGDGINRLLNIILAMVNCEGELFLIDEFEVGLHWSVQVDLWKMIYQLAEKLDIQVVATTHSRDTILALQKATVACEQQENVQFIKLSNKSGTIKVIEYDFENVVIAMEDNLEMR